jgi:hypothetical protein
MLQPVNHRTHAVREERAQENAEKKVMNQESRPPCTRPGKPACVLCSLETGKEAGEMLSK